MFYTIYKTINTINQKYYIGFHITDHPHDEYLGSGRYLKSSIKKYGIENFKKEILFIFDNAEDMFAKENELVTEETLKDPQCMNLMEGGKGGWDWVNKNKLYLNGSGYYKTGNKWFQEKIKNDIFFKKDFSNKIKKGMKKSLKFKNRKNISFLGKTHSSETIEKMKSSHKGKHEGSKNSQHGTCWITNGTESKKMKKNDLIPEGWYKGRK